MSERDMMYGGYYQNIPGNISYGNFGYQGMPGSLMPMQGMMPNNQYIMNNDSCLLYTSPSPRDTT